jgi:hypothetical protein
MSFIFSANLNKFPNPDKNTKSRVSFILSLPIEERSFHPPEYSESSSSAPLAIEAPMAGKF